MLTTNPTKLSKSLTENDKRQELEEPLQVYKEPTLVNEIIYIILFRSSIVLFFQVLYNYPISLYTHVSFLILSYIQENLSFILRHIYLHVNFLYTKPTFNDMGIFCYTAYIHHYYNSLIFSQLEFMGYCNHYILSPVFILQISIIGYIMYYSGVNNTHIIIYTCYQILQNYLQAIVHLWYHTIKSKKLEHFGPLLYNIMLALESVKIISSEKHKLHHSHQIDNMEDVEVWNDLYLPPFVNNIGDTIFKYIVTLNKPNEEKLKTYMIIMITGLIIIILTITYICVFLCRVIM